MTRSTHTSKSPLRVGIIGSGFGGIALAVKLGKRTGATFVMFEQAAGIGGTWFENRYPGCEVDIPSHAYSFSFFGYDWPRTHATQPELLEYAERVVDEFGLRSHIRLNTRVTGVTWKEETSTYELRTDRDDVFEFDVVVSAVGLLSVPRFPDWPGLDEFEGVSFHTSQWEHEHELAGKTVAVVGTGSTAAQVVPALAPLAGKLLVFQREPGWVEPKHERPFTKTERFVYRRIPGALKLHRAHIFYKAGRRFKANDVESRRQKQMKQLCVDFIDSTIDDPQLRKAVTPDYPWGCKRPVVASTYYPALNKPNVDLVPHAVTRVTERGLIDDKGVEHPIDVLVLSTGFQPTRFLANLSVTGRNGVDLQASWVDRASAFLGITVPGFPNFFILYGPNTNGGTSIIAQLERQAEVAVSAIARLERSGDRVVDTDGAAAKHYVRWIDRQLASHASAMDAGCHNYYHSASGANVTQWPRTHLIYLLITKILPRFGLQYES